MTSRPQTPLQTYFLSLSDEDKRIKMKQLAAMLNIHTKSVYVYITGKQAMPKKHTAAFIEVTGLSRSDVTCRYKIKPIKPTALTPKGAQYIHHGFFYKVGVHKFLYQWVGYWRKSTQELSYIKKHGEAA